MSIIIDTPLRRISDKITPKYIGFSTVDIEYPDSYYLQDNIQAFQIDSNGDPVLDDLGEPVYDIISEFVLDSNGNKILQGIESPYVLDSVGDIVLATEEAYPYDDRPVLVPNWRLLRVPGIATPIETLETTTQYAMLQGDFRNLGKVWVGGRDVQVGRGMFLELGSPPVVWGIDDLRKLYIIGWAGDRVNINYGTREDIFLENTDGIGLDNTDGTPLNN